MDLTNAKWWMAIGLGLAINVLAYMYIMPMLCCGQ